MLKTQIVGHTNNYTADVVDGIEKNALVVATRPLKTLVNSPHFFLNDIYGADMNQNVSFGGTPDQIHDGIDTVLWTGSAISGTWDFVSTNQAHSGTQSVSGVNTLNDDIAQFDKGSDLTITNYTAITGWIYLTGWSVIGIKQVNIYAYDTTSNISISNELNIGNYIDTTTLGSWQKFIIPLNDFTFISNTLDSVRIRTVNTGGGVAPNYYLDDMQFEETGNPATFTIEPALGTWLHVHNLTFSIVDALPSTLADAGLPNLNYNKLLGATLLGGIVYHRNINNTIESQIFKTLIDLLELPNTKIYNSGSDGTNTFITVRTINSEPLILKSENKDTLTFTISDDLSVLLHLRISACCREEQR